MEIKKSSKADLEKDKTTSLLMGLVVGLAILFVAFEWNSSNKKVPFDESVAQVVDEDEKDIDITLPENISAPLPSTVAAPVQETDPSDAVAENEASFEQHDLIISENIQVTTQIQVQTTEVATPEVAKEETADPIFMVVEEAPSFPGGEVALLHYLSKSIKYPAIAQENGVHGRVICTFVINRNGSIVDAEVVRGVAPSLDKEALRVINSMPKWKPGRQGGRPVRVKYSVPITFRLQ